MLKQRLSAAEAVKAAFLSAEEAHDDAAIRATRCVLAMLEARRTSKVPLGTGLDALSELSRAASLSIEARAALVRAHPLMAQLPQDVGLAPFLYGDGWECPPVDPPSGEERPSLSVVA